MSARSLKLALMWAVMCLGLTGAFCNAHAQTTTTITGTDGGTDSWNTATNWDNGVPTGTANVVVASGVTVTVDNAATPAYTGTLTLESGAILKINGETGSENAVVGASGVTMKAGSILYINVKIDIALPPVTLSGDAQIANLFGVSDHETTTIPAISGAHALTLKGFNNHTFNLTAANGFSELISEAIDRYNIRASAAGAFGTGNVTVTGRADGRSAQIYLDVADTIADTATLTLNGKGFDGSTEDRITIATGVDEVVRKLIVDGVEMPYGTYDNTAAWLSGGGTLTVAPAPTTTITGTDGGNDSWNVATNWDKGIPTGDMHAVVASGVTAKVDNAATPSYIHTLKIESNATLSIAGAIGSETAVTSASSITMEGGSSLLMNLNANPTLPPITLTGDAMIDTPFGASDHQTTDITSVTGLHALTIKGFNGHTFNLNGANTFTEFISLARDRHRVRAKAAGCFGSGNVIITGRSDGRSAQLYLDVADTIADTATLALYGKGFDNLTEDRITIATGVNEVIGCLVVDNVMMPAGTYDSTSEWLSGGGTLTVTGNALADPIPATSPTSPLCMTGSIGTGAVTVSTDGTNYNAATALGFTWLYEAPLSSTAATPITVKSGETVTATQQVTWTATDITTTPSITIRKGDSLLLTVPGTGTTVKIDVDYDSAVGFIEDHIGVPSDKFVQAFDTAGVFIVEAELDGSSVGSMTVTVVGVDLQGPIACEIDYQRVKDVLVAGGTADDVVFTAANSALMFCDVKEVTTTGATLYLKPYTLSTPVLLARLGGESGPILAYQEVDEFTMATQATQVVSVKEQFEDGSLLIETNMEMFPKVNDLEVRLHIFVSGVTFEDSTLELTLDTTDFTFDEESGKYLHPYRMIMIPERQGGPCHNIKVFQNNVQVGGN